MTPLSLLMAYERAKSSNLPHLAAAFAELYRQSSRQFFPK